MGFEHEAKTDAEKKKRDAAMKIVKERFNGLIVFDKVPGSRTVLRLGSCAERITILKPKRTGRKIERSAASTASSKPCTNLSVIDRR